MQLVEMVFGKKPLIIAKIMEGIVTQSNVRTGIIIILMDVVIHVSLQRIISAIEMQIVWHHVINVEMGY